MNTKIKSIAAIACGVVACGLSQSAHASVNLVENGGFEQTSSGGVGRLGVSGFEATDWTPSGNSDNSYDFVFPYATATTTGAGGVSLYGPLPAATGGGNNFLGIDPVYTPNNPKTGIANSISQSIGNLIVGDTYTLSFYWAAAQQTGFYGNTTEGWKFGIGQTATTSQQVGLVNLTQGTFGGWNQYSETITASATTEILSFLAIGGPASTEPPFDLLDNVSLTQNTSVPDTTSTAGLLGLGVVAMGVAAGCRRFVRA